MVNKGIGTFGDSDFGQFEVDIKYRNGNVETHVTWSGHNPGINPCLCSFKITYPWACFFVGAYEIDQGVNAKNKYKVGDIYGDSPVLRL